MISPEIIRRYSFFAGLSHEHVITLAKVAEEIVVETGHYFFHEGDELDQLYLVVEGAVAIVIEVPAADVEHKLSEQFTGELKTEDVVLSAIGPGEVFGWSALVPPHQATTSGKATTPGRVIALDAQELLSIFEDNCRFGYLMIQKMAQVVRDRLRDMRTESLAHIVG
ncbi:MAG: cyclic nucleotide-binding domain-containing protein [Anaerolineae bacterium]|nr:cyclic nucleotide-binding domain-containing protein [Anaerolineae bacterium]